MYEAESAPKKRTHLRKIEAFDADLHARNLTDWQQEYDQISCGGFQGSITELAFDDLQVFHEHTSQALQQKCIVWPDSVWLGIPLQQQPESRINGLAVNGNDIMCRPGSCEFQLSTPKDFHIYGMVVKHKSLMEAATLHGIEVDPSELHSHGRLALPQKIIQDSRFLLSHLLDPAKNAIANNTTRDVILIALLEILKRETPQPAENRSYQHRKRVVDDARMFIEASTEAPVTITDLCRATNVSRRTLQYSFESIIGISPIQFLRFFRLNNARRALLEASREECVTDIASQWGFWHMSQFAKDYNHLFGELPSQTLESRTTGLSSKLPFQTHAELL